MYGLAAHDLDTNAWFGPFIWDFPTLAEAIAEANKGEPIDPALLQRRHAEVTLVGVRRIPPAARAAEPPVPPPQQAPQGAQSISEPPLAFIDECVELHAKGDRRPVLMEVIDRFAWSLYHDDHEIPPGVQMTSLERDLHLLRLHLPGRSDVELLTMHQENPMLMATVQNEIGLKELGERVPVRKKMAKE